jgi:two-component system response regulator FixJ
MTEAILPIVYIVDDDTAVADSASMLLRSVGLETQCFADAESFLEGYRPELPGCLLLDVRMPRVSGLELQLELNRRHYTLPIIFVTGHGDVPMAVEAMRAGAVDFLQKPFNDEDLIRRVQRAIAQDAREREALKGREEIRSRWASLTPREQEVAERLVDGQLNKVIAHEMGISERTVELHRAHVMRKMETRAFAHLVQMLLVLREGNTTSS